VVFGGMLISTVVNLGFIPGLYVLVQRRRGARAVGTLAEDAQGAGHAPPTA
jgi:HAE1 family hydrophobic/amphiphilic exporter-1